MVSFGIDGLEARGSAASEEATTRRLNFQL